MEQPDWSRLVLDPSWLARLEQRAGRRFPDPATADEAVTWVLEQLSADDWSRCRCYTGRSKPETWLYSLSANLLEEFSRKRFGRVRPPQWLVDQGNVWLELWQQICLDRRPVQQVIDAMSHDGQLEPELLMNIVSTIKARLPWCGASHLPIPLEHRDTEGEPTSLLDRMPGHPDVERALARDRRESMLATVAALLEEEPAGARRVVDDTDRLEHLRRQLDLGDEDFLILRMHYRDGMSFSAIARVLGVASHRPGRQMKRILAHIHTAMQEAGIAMESLRDELDGRDEPDPNPVQSHV